MTNELWNRALRLVGIGTQAANDYDATVESIGVAKELYEAAAVYRTGKQQDVLNGWVKPQVRDEARRQVTEAVMLVQKDIDTWRTKSPAE